MCAVTASRTSVAKNLDELFYYIQVDDTDADPLTIVTARAVTRRLGFSDATTVVSTTEAARGAGHTIPTADKGYIVALTGVRSATTLTLDGADTVFAEGDPPGTAMVNATDAAKDLTAVPTVAGATVGDMFAVVDQPATYSWSANGIPYITAVSQESPPIRRDIRDKGQLQHRKKMSIENGVLTLTALYENAKKGLSKYVDRDIIIIGERIDDRGVTITEKLIFYGARINAIPAPNESEGDVDTNIVIPVSYELLAIVGDTGAA